MQDTLDWTGLHRTTVLNILNGKLNGSGSEATQRASIVRQRTPTVRQVARKMGKRRSNSTQARRTAKPGSIGLFRNPDQRSLVSIPANWTTIWVDISASRPTSSINIHSSINIQVKNSGRPSDFTVAFESTHDQPNLGRTQIGCVHDSISETRVKNQEPRYCTVDRTSGDSQATTQSNRVTLSVADDVSAASSKARGPAAGNCLARDLRLVPQGYTDIVAIDELVTLIKKPSVSRSPTVIPLDFREVHLVGTIARRGDGTSAYRKRPFPACLARG